MSHYAGLGLRERKNWKSSVVSASTISVIVLIGMGVGCDPPGTAADSGSLTGAIIQQSAFLDTIQWAYRYADPVTLQEVHFAPFDTFRVAVDRMFSAYTAARIGASVRGPTPYFTGTSAFGQPILANDYRNRECVQAVSETDVQRLQQVASDVRLTGSHFHILSVHCLRRNQLPLDLVEQGEPVGSISTTGGISLRIDTSNVNRIKAFPEERWSYLFVFDLRRLADLSFSLSPDSAVFAFESAFVWTAVHELGHQFGLSHADTFINYHNLNFANDIMAAGTPLRDMIRNPQPVFCHNDPHEDYTERRSCRANLFMNRDSI